jgi:hypothetical protein
MPSPDSTGLPDYDPTASSGVPVRAIAAPIPIPDSADVPEVVRERHDEPGGPTRVSLPGRAAITPDQPVLQATLGRLLEGERDAGARHALWRCRHALQNSSADEVMATLRGLNDGPTRAVLDALDQLAEGGE